ncbi:hypothetical protein DFH06DRAFT_1211605 [Mycena polygramma]|nr:hypothetical protein DFH06DRAFT_1211605 [Mycena polygramma]
MSMMSLLNSLSLAAMLSAAPAPLLSPFNDGIRPRLTSLRAGRPASTPTLRTPPRRARSSPPESTPKMASSTTSTLALLPPPGSSIHNMNQILEFYLAETLAPYLEDERGISSIRYFISTNSRFLVPATTRAYMTYSS